MDDIAAQPLDPDLTFADLVARSGGRHPIELLSALNDGSSDAGARRLAREAAAAPSCQRMLPQGDGLALPHPLDAEWRFEDVSADELLARAVERTGPNDAILLLGVPTVVLSALRSRAVRRFMVACEDNVIGTTLNARVADDPRFVAAAPDGCGAAIVDPPWYPALFDGLLTQAAMACRPGGWVLVGAPSEGVRPTIVEERRATVAIAAAAGLVHSASEAEALAYRTPAFEVAAMQASGLRAWLPSWRRADLLIFRKTGTGLGPAPPMPSPAFELTLEGVRLRLVGGSARGAQAIRAIRRGEVFPSVSARAVGRRRANLWTSSNRAFVCNPHATLLAMLRLAEERDLWPKGLDSAGKESLDSASIDVIPLVEELSRIAARDLAHTAMLVGESSWDRAANDARFLNGSSTAFLQALPGVRASRPSSPSARSWRASISRSLSSRS